MSSAVVASAEPAVLEALASRGVVGVVDDHGDRDRPRVASGAVSHPVDGPPAPGSPRPEIFDFGLDAATIGLPAGDRRLYAMAATAAGCHPAELVHVTERADGLSGPQAAGARTVWLNPSAAFVPPGAEPDATITEPGELPAVLDRFDDEERALTGSVGVGPHPRPWPGGDHLDPELMSLGDRRNVIDRYRYWRESAIVADLAQRRHPFHVAVENWRHDRNIGAVVRNANAFGAGGVHIVGRRRWNRRGAMATDRYLEVHHHDSVARFLAWAEGEGLPLVGIDNIAGSTPIEVEPLPERCVLVFGQEGPGLSEEMVVASEVRAITQYGSTRSLNAGVASGIAMYAWATVHANGQDWQDRATPS